MFLRYYILHILYQIWRVLQNLQQKNKNFLMSCRQKHWLLLSYICLLVKLFLYTNPFGGKHNYLGNHCTNINKFAINFFKQFGLCYSWRNCQKIKKINLISILISISNSFSLFFFWRSSSQSSSGQHHPSFHLNQLGPGLDHSKYQVGVRLSVSRFPGILFVNILFYDLTYKNNSLVIWFNYSKKPYQPTSNHL